MTHRALIAVADGVEDIETVTLIDVLRRAEVEVVVAEGLTASVRPLAFKRAMVNLAGNAASHGDHVRLSARALASGGLEIIVEDDGPGIPDDLRPHVFERFYRGDSSRHRGSGGGSGLGLSIVAALVAAHGGRVGVDTSPGVGATFWVRLPRLDD